MRWRFISLLMVAACSDVLTPEAACIVVADHVAEAQDVYGEWYETEDTDAPLSEVRVTRCDDLLSDVDAGTASVVATLAFDSIGNQIVPQVETVETHTADCALTLFDQGWVVDGECAQID